MPGRIRTARPKLSADDARARERETSIFVQEFVNQALGRAAQRTGALVRVPAATRRHLAAAATSFLAANRDDLRRTPKWPSDDPLSWVTDGAAALFRRRYEADPSAFYTSRKEEAAQIRLIEAADDQGPAAYYVDSDGDLAVVPGELDEGGFVVTDDVPGGDYVVRGNRSGAVYWRGGALEGGLEGALRAEARLNHYTPGARGAAKANGAKAGVKLTPTFGGVSRVSDADAGRLARAVDARLPRLGWELTVDHPRGGRATLRRTQVTAADPGVPESHRRRGWMWTINTLGRR